jgi:60 kDa SS-A/Ro ribonucleoprotein
MRGAAARAPDLSGGLGGAPRPPADDGADPQPGHDDAYELLGFYAGRGGWKTGTRSAGWGANGLMPLAISPRQRLDDAAKAVSDLPFGGTDCALPMLSAQARKQEVDTFVISTDSETWAGDVHPAQALRDYRQVSGIDARLVVVGMLSSGFSIADPADPEMLDVVGVDTATPQLISDFARGSL